MNARRWIALTALLTMVLIINGMILRSEHLRTSGRVFWLELAPVDPRSLMQGDYMALDFVLAQDLARQLQAMPQTPVHGTAVLDLDADGVARQIRPATAGAVAPDQQLLRYHYQQGRVRMITDAWFFPEGQAERYAVARFGQFRGALDGRALLVGMADAHRALITASSPHTAHP